MLTVKEEGHDIVGIKVGLEHLQKMIHQLWEEFYK